MLSLFFCFCFFFCFFFDDDDADDKQKHKLTTYHPMPPFLRQHHNHRHFDYDQRENRTWTDEGVCVQDVNVWIQVKMVKNVRVELNQCP